jgi:hypothetical protein
MKISLCLLCDYFVRSVVRNISHHREHGEGTEKSQRFMSIQRDEFRRRRCENGGGRSCGRSGAAFPPMSPTNRRAKLCGRRQTTFANNLRKGMVQNPDKPQNRLSSIPTNCLANRESRWHLPENNQSVWSANNSNHNCIESRGVSREL